MPNLMKSEGWEFRLKTYIEDLRYKPYQWRTNDCFSFIRGCTLAMTGFDISKTMTLQYHSMKDVYRYIEKNGGWENVVTSVFGIASTTFDRESVLRNN